MVILAHLCGTARQPHWTGPCTSPRCTNPRSPCGLGGSWLRGLPAAPDQVYVVHGEPGPADELRKRIKHELGWRAIVPEHGSVWPS